MGSLRTFGLLAATALLFVAAPAPSAQQGGTAGVGIIGGVQPGQFPTAGRVKVVQPNGPQFFVPLNGIRNYLVFYAPDANGNDRFAPAGTYSFEYQTSGGSHAIDNGTLFNGSANYQPNFTFSQGGVIVVRSNGQVQSPNISPNPSVGRGPLGIQGFVQNESGTRLFNANVELRRCSSSTSCSSSTFVANVRTNGNGFYSFYYTEGTNKNFIQPGFYKVTASSAGFLPDTATKQYSPVTNTASVDYFVLGAQESAAGVRTLVLRQPYTGCGPMPYAAGSDPGEPMALPFPCIEEYRTAGPELTDAESAPLPTAVPMPDADRRVVFGPVSTAPATSATPSMSGSGFAASLEADETALLGAWPNPVASRGTVRFSTATDADVQLDLYDVLGRQVATLAEGALGAGRHEAAIDVRSLSPGTYVLRLTTAGEVRTTVVTVAR